MSVLTCYMCARVVESVHFEVSGGAVVAFPHPCRCMVSVDAGVAMVKSLHPDMKVIEQSLGEEE